VSGRTSRARPLEQIAACLLAVGYHAEDLKEILSVTYRKFADYGPGGLPRAAITAVGRRGLKAAALLPTATGSTARTCLARRAVPLLDLSIELDNSWGCDVVVERTR
jgi:hypothetical protein